jgi:tripartite-type tricarboxylate transporter receptor subunit TctC
MTMVDVYGRWHKASHNPAGDRQCNNTSVEDEPMRLSRRQFAASVGASAVALAAPAIGQEKYPSRPIKVFVPYAPGGATDFAARLVSEKARAALGVNIIIENKPGAQGRLSLEELGRAKPDGYTLMIGNVTTNCITPVLFGKQLSFDYDRDVTAVSRLLVTPNVLLVTHQGFPPRTYKDTIEYIRMNPGKVRYGSSGIASFPHYDTALLAKRLNLDMIHVPYKGGAGDMVKGIVNGEIQITLLSTPITLPQIQAKTVTAISNINTRLPQFADLPTLAEHGLPDVGTDNWSAVFAPAKTPPEVIAILYKAFTDAANDPAVVDAAAKTGSIVWTTNSVAETGQWLRSEMKKWRGITDEIKVEMN